MQSHCPPIRVDHSRDSAIARSTDWWIRLDGPSDNRLLDLRAERSANWPPILLTPFQPDRAVWKTKGLIHLYLTPVASGWRLYMVHRSGLADALHDFATLQLNLHCIFYLPRNRPVRPEWSPRADWPDSLGVLGRKRHPADATLAIAG